MIELHVGMDSDKLDLSWFMFSCQIFWEEYLFSIQAAKYFSQERLSLREQFLAKIQWLSDFCGCWCYLNSFIYHLSSLSIWVIELVCSYKQKIQPNVWHFNFLHSRAADWAELSSSQEASYHIMSTEIPDSPGNIRFRKVLTNEKSFWSIVQVAWSSCCIQNWLWGCT